jgi:hypothetical protein
LGFIFKKEGIMTKQVQMTFRVAPELRASFAKIAIIENRPAAQILREFMQTYITDAQSVPAQRLMPSEQHKRQQAVNFARASVGLEGLHLSQEAEHNVQRFVNGEIDFNAFMKISSPAKQTQ